MSNNENGDGPRPREKTSAAKQEANRLNSLKSTGPRTEIGKRHSRRNALQHGMRATTLLVEPGTLEHDKFQDVLAELREDYAPSTYTEDLHLQNLALAVLRAKRGNRLEGDFAGLITKEFDRVTRYTNAALKQFNHCLAKVEEMQERENAEEEMSSTSGDTEEGEGQ